MPMETGERLRTLKNAVSRHGTSPAGRKSAKTPAKRPKTGAKADVRVWEYREVGCRSF